MNDGNANLGYIRSLEDKFRTSLAKYDRLAFEAYVKKEDTFKMNEGMVQERELPARKESGRLLALDAARGLAVIGMYIQHFALSERNSFVSGNTMILFMLCSGISYTIMVQRMLEENSDRKSLNTRILVRSVFIDFAGYLLILLNGPFAVVLTAYAMLYLLALLLVHLSTARLFLLSGIAFIVCPPLMLIGMSLLEGAALLQDIAGGPLSALAWAPVFLAGMAIGRLDLHKTQNAVRFLAAGVIVLVPVKLVEIFVMPGIYESYMEWASQNPAMMAAKIDTYAVWPYNTQPVMWQMLFISMPQGGSSCELLAGIGGSLILFGFLCLAEKKYGMLLKPFSNAGRLSLTLYVTQIIAGWGLQVISAESILMDMGAVPFGDILTAVSVIFLSCLFTRFKNGPFEALLRMFEKKFI